MTSTDTQVGDQWGAGLDPHQRKAIEHAAMDAGAYSWRNCRLAMVEDGKVIGYPVFSRADMAELARLYREEPAPPAASVSPGTSNASEHPIRGEGEALRELTSAAARVFNNIHSGRYTRGQVCDWLREPIDKAQAVLHAHPPTSYEGEGLREKVARAIDGNEAFIDAVIPYYRIPLTRSLTQAILQALQSASEK